MPSVGDAITAEAGAWTFGSGVAERFDSHVVRSLPMYEATHALICDLADDFVPSRSRVYDLGCSTGTLLELLALRLRDRQAEIVGVDSNPRCWHGLGFGAHGTRTWYSSRPISSTSRLNRRISLSRTTRCSSFPRIGAARS